MKTFAIGDIHGHLRALEAILDAAPISAGDLVIFLGDYVDKGPDSKGVLDLMVRLTRRPRTVFLRGNHDQMLFHARSDPAKFPIWECLAGKDPLASYGAGDSEELIRLVPERHWQFLGDDCVDYFENDYFIFVHAGIRPDQAPETEDTDHLHWLTLPMAQPHNSKRTVICGHSAQESHRIADLGHTVCIDTGISKGGLLTCLELNGFEFWQSSPEGTIHGGCLR